MRYLFAVLLWVTPAWSAPREVLTADLDLFVRAGGKGDCLTRETACSVDEAIAGVSLLDYGNRTVSIRSLGGGTHRGRVEVPPQVGGGALVFIGGTYDGGGRDCFTLFDVGTTKVGFFDLKLTTTGGSGAINIVGTSTAVIGRGVDFGQSANAHVYVHDANAQALFLNGSYKISGRANYHIFNNGGQVFHEYATATCTAPVCEFHAFASVLMNGKLQTTGSKFVGEFKGMPYLLYLGGAINTFGALLPYLPGDRPGQVVVDQYR